MATNPVSSSNNQVAGYSVEDYLEATPLNHNRHNNRRRLVLVFLAPNPQIRRQPPLETYLAIPLGKTILVRRWPLHNPRIRCLVLPWVNRPPLNRRRAHLVQVHYSRSPRPTPWELRRPIPSPLGICLGAHCSVVPLDHQPFPRLSLPK